MTDAAADQTERPARAGKGPLLIGLILAIAGAGGGFFAARSGILPIPGGASQPAETTAAQAHVNTHNDIAFVKVPTMVISYTDRGRRQVLRFTAEIEVGQQAQADVELLIPRIVDVLNGYLRAIELDDIDDPSALTRLRAQMLRRIQIVAGRDAVRDLLIMEFVLT